MNQGMSWQAYLDVDRPVLLTGTTGVGKSVVAAMALDGLRARKSALPFGISFSAQTAASDTQVRGESFIPGPGLRLAD